jgi:S1-C subfamily serine protease
VIEDARCFSNERNAQNSSYDECCKNSPSNLNSKQGHTFSSSESADTLVEDLVENGPTSKSNLEKGNIIQEVNVTGVKPSGELLKLLSYYAPLTK